ncbi:helix-hairpin-helix domain-containing protein [Sinomonas humi]|uniref:helix-hairpin-helix domain-containing protein n=1 Tax=Sinomonas humi TaxID=1338436 RepID=UPI0038B422DE
MPTYQTAWLKAHHPEAFLAGVFEHEPGMCPKRVLVAEARRMDVPILPLDINASRDEYRVERVEEGPDAGRLGIRFALKGITGVSEAELRRIVDGQPYATIADLRDRARLSRSSLRRLAELGALDSLHRDVAARGSRADLLAHLAQLASRPASRRDEPIEGQLALDIA